MNFIDQEKLDKEAKKLIKYLEERDLTNQEVIFLLKYLVDFLHTKDSVKYTGNILATSIE